MRLAGGLLRRTSADCAVPDRRPSVAVATTAIATPSGPITITYWETDADDADVVLDELAAEFMKANPAITVKRAHYSYDDLRNEFRAKSFNGQPPELCTHRVIHRAVQRTQDRPPARRDLQQGLPGSIPHRRAGRGDDAGQAVGLPDNYGNHLMLLYNKALVTEVPLNTDAWIAQLRRSLIRRFRNTVWPIPRRVVLADPLAGRLRRLAHGCGRSARAEHGGDGQRVAVSLRPQGHAPCRAGQADYDAAFDFFRQGKAAYIIDGTWNLDRYTDLGIDVGVAPLPVVSATGLRPAPMATGSYWLISEKARRRARCHDPFRRVHDSPTRRDSGWRNEASAQQQRGWERATRH